MNTQDVKGMAQQAGRKLQTIVQDDSPMGRLQDVAQSADHNIRQFSKTQPVLALGIAIAAGYLVGRAMARTR